MKLKIPFFPNNGDGNQCMQVSMQSVIKYFTGKTISPKLLDKKTQRKEKGWTYTVQIIPVLKEYKLDVVYYTTGSMNANLKEEIKKEFPKQYTQILKLTNVKAVNASIKKTKYIKKKCTIKDIKKALLQGHVPMIIFNSNIMYKTGSTKYAGHFCVVTGFSKNYFYIHENGPKNPTPHKRILQKDFSRGWHAKGTGSELVIVKRLVKKIKK